MQCEMNVHRDPQGLNRPNYPHRPYVLRPERGCDCPPRAPIGVDSTGPTRIREMVIGRSKRRKKLLILGWPGPIV